MIKIWTQVFLTLEPDFIPNMRAHGTRRRRQTVSVEEGRSHWKWQPHSMGGPCLLYHRVLLPELNTKTVPRGLKVSENLYRATPVLSWRENYRPRANWEISAFGKRHTTFWVKNVILNLEVQGPFGYENQFIFLEHMSLPCGFQVVTLLWSLSTFLLILGGVLKEKMIIKAYVGRIVG